MTVVKQWLAECSHHRCLHRLRHDCVSSSSNLVDGWGPNIRYGSILSPHLHPAKIRQIPI